MTARLFECAFILVGIVAVLRIVTLQKEVAGGAEGTVAYTLAAIKDWTFLLGPGWVVGWGNGLILGYLMYSTGLVPRKMAMLGLIGGVLIILSGTLVLFGVVDNGGTLQGLATIPEGLLELSLGIYCTVKGFRPSSPILKGRRPRCPPQAHTRLNARLTPNRVESTRPRTRKPRSPGSRRRAPQARRIRRRGRPASARRPRAMADGTPRR